MRDARCEMRDARCEIIHIFSFSVNIFSLPFCINLGFYLLSETISLNFMPDKNNTPSLRKELHDSKGTC